MKVFFGIESVESGTIHHRAGCRLSHDLFPRQLAALKLK